MSVNNSFADLAACISNKAFVIDANANIKNSVNSILLAKTGAIKNSTLVQSIIVASEVYELVKQEFMCCSAYFLSQKEKQLLNKLIENKNFNLTVKVSLQQLAQLAGIQLQRELYGCDSDIYCPLPSSYKLLIVEIETTFGETCIYNMLANYPILLMYRNK